jgi:hypothetical protein
VETRQGLNQCYHITFWIIPFTACHVSQIFWIGPSAVEMLEALQRPMHQQIALKAECFTCRKRLERCNRKTGALPSSGAGGLLSAVTMGARFTPATTMRYMREKSLPGKPERILGMAHPLAYLACPICIAAISLDRCDASVSTKTLSPCMAGLRYILLKNRR